jgi:protein tyrosine/serine phosphatase
MMPMKSHHSLSSRIALAVGIGVAGLVFVWSVTVGDVGSPPSTVPVRPAAWATPVSTNGLPNLHKVSDVLYRSAQPTADGFATVKGMGVKTVVNLRSFHSDKELLGDTGLGYEHITMKAWHAEEKEVVRFLKIVANQENQPVLVHCQHGADRTGTMCAIYRVAVQGWSKEEALNEMRNGGYGFFDGWQNLVKFINDLDVDDVRKKAGLKE